MKFKDRIVLVTGSGRGIGSAAAKYFASEGAHIVINYVRNQEDAEETAETVRSFGARALVVRANIGKMDGLEKLFAAVESAFSRLDIFISNAASGFNRPALEQKPSGWDHTMNVNARAFLFGSQLAVPLMEKAGGGHIVAVTSPGGDIVLPDYVAVGASKAALNSLVRYLAVELAPRNIRVNAVSPGLVETEALKHFSHMRDSDVIPRTESLTPAGRIATPEDIAGVIGFLCSQEAEMIRGQIITADGGFTLKGQE